MRPRIYIQDWLNFKPYDAQVTSDGYYLKLCNDVLSVLWKKKQTFVDEFGLEEDYLRDLTCFLTSYFEDIISETNIWNSFVRLHNGLYEKELPFYKLEGYIPEEINVQDIAFLMCYYTNTVQQEKFAEPFKSFIVDSAPQVFEIFARAWEFAPENENLSFYYQIDEDEDDYYVVRQLMDNILFESYLFYTDTRTKLDEIQIDLVNKIEDFDDLKLLLNERRLESIHKSRTRLLNLSGAEWAAEIIGNKHPLYTPILNISPRITGYFFYKGESLENLFFEHIASGIKFTMTKKSFEEFSVKIETKIDTIFHLAIVQWKKEWWLSGTLMEVPFNTDLIMDEKNSVQSRLMVSFLDHDSTKVKELLEKQFQAFKDFNEGAQIVFLKSNKIEDFYKSFTDFFNNSLNLTKKEKMEALDRTKKSGFFGGEDVKTQFNEISESGLIFFNPKSGMEVVLDCNSAFPLPDNPYFLEKLCVEHTIRLISDPGISADLVYFCLENCENKLPYFTEGLGSVFINDIDFLLRFWKPENYFAKPTITFV